MRPGLPSGNDVADALQVLLLCFIVSFPIFKIAVGYANRKTPEGVVTPVIITTAALLLIRVYQYMATGSQF